MARAAILVMLAISRQLVPLIVTQPVTESVLPLLRADEDIVVWWATSVVAREGFTISPAVL